MIKHISIILICVYLNIHVVKNCENNKNVQTRIIGGNEVLFNDYPYMAAIFEQETNKFFCGGTIIRKDWILTAAHCVDGKSELYVRVGSLRVEGGGQVIDVLIVISNRWYNRKTIENDVALLYVGNNMELSENVAPIDMVDVDYVLPNPGAIVRVIGFGIYTARPEDQNLRLKEAEVAMMDFESCKHVYRDSRVKPKDTMFCLNNTADGTRYCDGDSGGPAVYNLKLIGIISWVKNCRREVNPMVLQKVNHFRPWINNIMDTYSLR